MPIAVVPLERPDAAVQAVDAGISVSAASARTQAIVETVGALVDEIVGRIQVTPSIVKGEGEVRITLRPTVLDGSDITISASGGNLSVAVVPATPEAAQAAAAALPRLETALAEHVTAFRHVSVALVSKKENTDETA